MVVKKMKLRLTTGVEHTHCEVLNFSDVLSEIQKSTALPVLYWQHTVLFWRQASTPCSLFSKACLLDPDVASDLELKANLGRI